MAIRIKNVDVHVVDQSPDDHLREAIAATLNIPSEDVLGFRILKKSLDARRKSRIVYHYQVEADLRDEEAVLSLHSQTCEPAHADAVADPFAGLEPHRIKFRHKPIIIGSGPAGTFVAHVLAEAGHPCVVVERGEAVEQRLRTVNRLRRSGEFTAESNYCYGEGGAGTFSDGKLTCGRNHPLIRYLFQQWVRFGAPAEILYDAHPHIGTDYLMVLAKRMRDHILSVGSEYRFQRRWVSFESGGAAARYLVTLDNGEIIPTDHLVVAIGHSARETYQMLFDKGVAIAPKPFAIGARIEHPQEVIDQIQFGSCRLLPAAEYKLVSHEGERGIWTFCMCPGGHLLPTGAQDGHLAINGMSYHARNSGFANAAVVVNVQREDFFRGHPLDGMHFQARIEQAAFHAGGGEYRAPVQRLNDFLKGRQSTGELSSSYKPGIVPGRLDQILPAFVVESLKKAIVDYDKKMRGYLDDRGLVAGVETKTSSPIVMNRDKSLQSVSHPGFFPTGEGAGFAGGIVSASLDGVKVGRAVLDDAAGVVL